MPINYISVNTKKPSTLSLLKPKSLGKFVACGDLMLRLCCFTNLLSQKTPAISSWPLKLVNILS